MANAIATTHLTAAFKEARAFHRGAGVAGSGNQQHPILTPLQRYVAAAVVGAAPGVARLILAGWQDTDEAEFVTLVNAVIAGYVTPTGQRRPVIVPDYGRAVRSCAQFSDCKPLQAIFSVTLTFTQKLQQLRDFARDAQAAAGQVARRKDRAERCRKKRDKGTSSRRKGEYGTSKAGLPRRSPHVAGSDKRAQFVYSPPPTAAAVSALVRRGRGGT